MESIVKGQGSVQEEMAQDGKRLHDGDREIDPGEGGGTTENPTKNWISTVQLAEVGGRIDLATEMRLWM
ncbi:MAG: hypothetical protein WA172_13095 [Terriglobales bacterium]